MTVLRVSYSRNSGLVGACSKVEVRLPGKGNSNPHGARPVHLIIMMIKWTRTSRLSIKNFLSAGSPGATPLESACDAIDRLKHHSQVPLPNVQRFRGGLVFEADRLLYHSTLGSRVIKKRRRGFGEANSCPRPLPSSGSHLQRAKGRALFKGQRAERPAFQRAKGKG